MAIEISTDKAKLDYGLIHDYLAHQSYWAQGRSMEIVKKSVQNSLCFGAYLSGKQIGFARVVTDYTVFAWLMDVFIVDAHKGRGYGQRLIQSILNHPDLQNLQRWGLATNDAHGLYAKFGFTALHNPTKMMERVSKPR